ncbi:maleylpyruvate isomerase N-terminal domain-containing protein [Pseudonocardia parietis]|uniref:Uncharacterized protein (TIGR03083 family) n=1 Tax=Pseudonocardia parietis TaxID=570936 RepID=A0ABS4W646_9PSEU|nr:maleylpyruvate isomerase N-terminal domain-containing protein [Pseudonocardia parietis]MBP2371684.1 uncharacterized protein (TIGR03083 family) [Pseudonocardia parietis]
MEQLGDVSSGRAHWGAMVHDVRYRDRVDALDATWAAWARIAATLTGNDWASPSRCAGWDVAALYAHVGLFPHAVRNAPPPPPDPGVALTAAEILRGFNAATGVAHEMAAEVADGAVRAAAATGPDGLRRIFTHDAPHAVAILNKHAGADVVAWPAADGVTTWGEAVRIVLLESTVHLLDVLDALGHAPDVAPTALRETAHLLAEIADPVALIETATGRTPTPVFPLLR